MEQSFGSAAQEPLSLIGSHEHGEALDALRHNLDVPHPMGVGARRLIRILFQQLLRRSLRRAAVLSDEGADVEEQLGSGVEERIEAGVIVPDRLVPLGVREDGRDVRAP